MKAVPSVIAVLLTYMFVAPVVGTPVVLLALGAPPDVWKSGVALLLTIGFGYILGFLPAMGAGLVAATVREQTRWVRLVLPAAVAIGLSLVIFRFVLHPGPGEPPPGLKTAVELASLLGALVSGVYLEWRRGRAAKATL